MKNRTVIGIICIALALVVMFGVSPFISMLSAEKVTVVQVNKNILEGQLIGEDDVELVEIGKHGTPETLITTTEEVIGKYANTDLYPGTNLIPAMLTEDSFNTATVLNTLDKNNLAISISVPTFAAALSAKLENGDIVCVNVTTTEETFVPEELRYVRVITTTTSEGIDVSDIEAASEGDEESDTTERLPATITLLVSPLQAKLLAQYEAQADMHLALVSRGNADAAKEYLAEQTAILERIVAEQNAELADQGIVPEDPTEPTENEDEAEGGAENE